MVFFLPNLYPNRVRGRFNEFGSNIRIEVVSDKWCQKYDNSGVYGNILMEIMMWGVGGGGGGLPINTSVFNPLPNSCSFLKIYLPNSYKNAGL